jgi:hypothetical protein
MMAKNVLTVQLVVNWQLESLVVVLFQEPSAAQIRSIAVLKATLVTQLQKLAVTKKQKL